MAIKTSQHFFLCIFYVSHSLEKYKNLWETIVCSSRALAVLPNLEEYGIYFFSSPHFGPIALNLTCQGCRRPPITTHLSASCAAGHLHPADSLLASGPHIVQIFILLGGSLANFRAYPLRAGILCVCVFSCWTVLYVTCVQCSDSQF